jgi:hypothetical protein
MELAATLHRHRRLLSGVRSGPRSVTRRGGASKLDCSA